MSIPNTDSNLFSNERQLLENLIEARGIDQVLIALSELCGARGEHCEETWQNLELAKAWFTVEGALGTAVTYTRGL